MPNKRPLVSVVVPAYNTRHTIADTIDSILKQTYKNYEIIVVEDGSPDDVADFVTKKYKDKVTLIRQSNQGLAGARNTGINASKGEFIAFLDSDDQWLPEKLQHQIAQAESLPDVDIFYGDCYFQAEGKRGGRWSEIHGMANGNIFKELINRTVAIPVLTVLIRSAVLKDTQFNDSLREVEDYDLWLRLALNGSRFAYLGEAMALYTINPLGLSSNRLRMATTQARVYHDLLQKVHDDHFRSLILKQISIYELEKILLERRAKLESGNNASAAILTLRIIRWKPLLTLKCAIMALLILFRVKPLTKRIIN